MAIKTKPFPQDAIDRQCRKIDAARSKASVQADMMPDYVEISGTRFYRPTIAHVWLLVIVEDEHKGKIGNARYMQLEGYILAHTQEEVRNKLYAEFAEGKILENAFSFITERITDIKDFARRIARLSAEISPQKKTDTAPADSNHTGGAE